MKFLIDIGHPAHVHLFRYFALEMLEKEHEVFFTCRSKEYEIELLSKFGLNFVSFGRKFNTAIGKMLGLARFDAKMLITAIKFRPDVYLSHGSMYAAHIAFLTGKPHISLEDTFNFEQVRLYKPFTGAILTADYDHPLKSRNVIRYSGYHELAYLHPIRFTPDKQVFAELGLQEDNPYVIIRFVSWLASHDIGHKGMSPENKLKAVKAFSRYAKVFISSESPLPPEFEPYHFDLPPYHMHQAISFASLVFGESATMASEAAMLGIPSIYLDNNGRYYTNEQQKKYGLVFNYTESEEDQQKAIEKGVELLKTPSIKEQWKIKRDKMLNDKIDVTAFLVWFIKNWPDSFNIMKENPDYQLNFK